MQGVYSIDPDLDFAGVAADQLLALAEETGTALETIEVLLPNRRAVRSLELALLRASGAQAMILPRLTAVADLADTVEAMRFSSAIMSDMPPAIHGHERQAILYQFVTLYGGPTGAGSSPPECWRLAGALARLLDEAQSEGVDLARLDDLVPEEFAHHWATIIEFLAIVRDHWPAYLAERGLVDPVTRRDMAIQALAIYWRNAPPDGPVLALGSTGTNRSVRALLAAIKSCPQGVLVLPGLDRDMDDAAWEALTPAHPQWAMKALLNDLQVHRHEVQPLGARPDPLARVGLLFDALRPSAVTHTWQGQHYDMAMREALLGKLSLFEATGRRQEALAIALAMRAALEVPEQTCALVTPDRRLAQLVKEILGVWMLTVDDSAGEPAAKSKTGRFLLALAQAAADGFSPLSLLAVLQHPFAALGQSRQDFFAFVRRLDLYVLRGPRPAVGLQGLKARFEDIARTRPGLEADGAVLEHLITALQPLEALTKEQGGSLTAEDCLTILVAVAEKLAATDRAGGDHALWARRDGHVLADHIHDLLIHAGSVSVPDFRSFPPLFEAMLAEAVVRTQWGTHPRLAILGAMEARLQRADIMILGGLNEGSWPEDPSPNPWLSEQMRLALGFASRDRRLGQQAHDFVQAAAADRVLLTRSLKVEGTPMVASRWLYRLEALLGTGLQRDQRIALWVNAYEGPRAGRGSLPPSPKPPVSARPKQLSVTGIETLMRDPYSLYARSILRLRPLDPVEADPAASTRGTLLHDALEKALKDVMTGKVAPYGPETRTHLLATGKEVFKPYSSLPTVYAFWWPRFVRVADWFLAIQETLWSGQRPVALEADARWPLPGRDFTLTARADRIDQHIADGTAVIIDYKTGQPPSDDRLAAGYAPQLPLEALLLEEGAFEALGSPSVARLEFWKLSGGREPGSIKRVKLPLDRLVTQARDGLFALVDSFAQDATPYLSEPRADEGGWGDYLHLARRAEWRLPGDVDDPSDGGF